MAMSDLQLDLLALAKVAAETGKIEARRVVLQFNRKHAGSEFGQHIAAICRANGIPVEAGPVDNEPSGLDDPRVLKASEVMDRLVSLACGDESRLGDYRVAFDFALADFGAKTVRNQLELLERMGETGAVIALAELVAGDPRKTYAEVGNRFIRRKNGNQTATGERLIVGAEPISFL